MAEIRTVTTLRREREESRRTIIGYEERLSQAKAGLAHIPAGLRAYCMVRGVAIKRSSTIRTQ